MALDNAINLLKSRGNSTVSDINLVIEAITFWTQLADNPECAHLIDFHRTSQATRQAVNALYRLEQHSDQYRKLCTSGDIPRLIEYK